MQETGHILSLVFPNTLKITHYNVKMSTVFLSKVNKNKSHLENQLYYLLKPNKN